MADVLKTFFEHGVWPTAIVILAFLFRRSVTRFLERVTQLKGAGVEVSAPSEAATQQVKNEKPLPNETLLIGDSGLQRIASSSDAEDLTARQEAARALGGSSEVVTLSIASIEDDLTKLHFPLDSLDTTRVLIRQLAVTALQVRFERIFRLIFGSQIAALQRLNELEPCSEAAVRSYYEHALSSSPDFFSNYSFEQWLGFLTNQQLVAYENGKYGISFLGREFLVWMINNGLGMKNF